MEIKSDWLIQLQDLTLLYVPKLLLAIVVLIIGWKLIALVVRALNTLLTRQEVETTLVHFLESMVGVLLKALLLISVASMVGIETTSFIAILGAAGLAVGLALQGSLANFAGGVLILLFKPYQVGHFIETQGHAGTVKEIQIFVTVLLTPDNKTIIIPNGPIANGSIINYSLMDTRRVEMVFGISYDDDIDKARAIIQSVIDKDERILKEPPSAILLAELADSSVNFKVRVWVNSGDYWAVYFENVEAVKKAFDQADITIPYPQRDIYLHQSP